jgi:predicted esterase
MNRPIAHAIQTPTHGRYLVRAPDQPGPVPLLVGFHGYAEAAETQLDRLGSIPGADRWLLVSIQGLHRFYRRRSADVVSSWMTRQDRDLALADNAAYVSAVLDAVTAVPAAGRDAVSAPVVFAGFSQGVAMAFRAACFLLSHKEQWRRLNRGISVIALGGDVPPELEREALAPLSSVLLGRGARDEWYTDAKWRSDTERLQRADVEVDAHELDAAHEWTADFSRAAGVFLDRRFVVIATV